MLYELKLDVINDIKEFKDRTISIKYQMKIYKKSYISKLIWKYFFGGKQT